MTEGHAGTGTGARAGWRALVITLAAFAVSMLADRWVFDHIIDAKVYERDWGRLLRVMGFFGTWIALGLAVGLVDRGGKRGAPTGAPAGRFRTRAWLLVFSAGLAGLVAEAMKLLIRRERPMLHDGGYGFRDFADRMWTGTGLALPSSHAAVAFGGAAMVARLFPEARWVGYVLAAGCGITRIMARAHFLSDVVLGAGVGWLVAWWLTRRGTPGRAAGAL